MLCITPAGTISFISKSYGGAASDCFITETCGIVNKLQFSDNLMADKGFNISDLLVSKGSRLIIPPFLRDKNIRTGFPRKIVKQLLMLQKLAYMWKGPLPENFQWCIPNNFKRSVR